jgi:hypothetical protein
MRLSCFHVVLLIYDYLLTLPTEIHIVWPWPKPWFMLVRYLALSTNIIMVALTFGTGGSQVCDNHVIATSCSLQRDRWICRSLRGRYWLKLRLQNSCKVLPLVQKIFLLAQDIITYGSLLSI